MAEIKAIAESITIEMRSYSDTSPAKAFCLRQLDGIRREAERRKGREIKALIHETYNAGPEIW